MHSPRDIQAQVASVIPLARFGARTRRMLEAEFHFGEDQKRKTIGEFARQLGTHLKEEAKAANAAPKAADGATAKAADAATAVPKLPAGLVPKANIHLKDEYKGGTSGQSSEYPSPTEKSGAQSMNNMSHFQQDKKLALRIDNPAGANYVVFSGMLGSGSGNFG
jgi:hypothetical protein